MENVGRPAAEWAGRELSGRDALLSEASARGRRFLEGVASRRVFPRDDVLRRLDSFDEPLPEEGSAASEVLARLDDVGSPATVASAGPRYFGFVIGGALPVAVASSWLSSAWDQNVALGVMSPVGARLEAVALAWLVDVLGLPERTGGGFVGGATMANATCLAAARDAVCASAGWDATSLGLSGGPPVEVVVGEEAHTTVRKALGLIGLGRDRVVTLPVDSEGRIVARGLPSLHPPAIVCLQAGNVNSGASDPFAPLVEWGHEEGAWVHVDGAFGLWARAAPSLAEQVRGVEAADSWAADAHKWLNTTYDSGIAFVADAGALRTAMAASAGYLPPGGERDPMHHTPQSSQRARAVECWAVLANLGRRGVGALVERSCALARRFAAGLEAGGHEILNDVVLNQVVVGFGSAARTDAVIAAVQADATCWCGPTTWHDRAAMRVSVSCWATGEDDVDQSVAAINAAAASVGRGRARST